MNHEREATEEMLKGFKYMLDLLYAKTTLNHDGLIVSSEANASGKWDVRFNGEVHALKPYGAIVPAKNMIVKVFVPQGNMSLAYFI